MKSWIEKERQEEAGSDIQSLPDCGGCCCSAAKLCPTLCDSKDCSMPGFLVLRHLPDSVQTRVHWVSDAIQPSHPLSPPSPPAFNLSQHHNLFQWVGTLHQVDTKFWSFNFSINPSMNIQGYLGLTRLIFLQSKGLSRIFSSTTIWKQQFFGVQPSFSPTLTSIHDYLKTIALTIWTYVGKVISLLSRFVIAFLPRSKCLLIL